MASEVMCALVADDPQNRYMVRMPETNSGAGEPIFPDHHRIGLPCAPNDRTWLRVLKKSEPTVFVQLSFLWADFEATLIQHLPGL